MSSIPIELFIPLLGFGLKGASLGIKLVKDRRRLRAWRDTAGACGLQIMETAGSTRCLTAQAGPVAVTIGPYDCIGRSSRIVVWVPGPSDFYNVSIRPEPLGRRAGKIEIGDNSFDKKFFIEGPMRQVLSLLDAETRRLLISANAWSRMEISKGLFRAEDTDDEQVPYVLPLLLDIGRRITRSTAIPRRLADNAKGDPEPGVRLQNLRCLIRELPEAPETLEAIRAACSDRSPEIRLQAAKGLGSEGRDLLLDLAESLVDDTVSAEAVSTLDRELSLERTKAILDHALDRRLPKTVRACLEALGKSGDAAAVDELGKVLALEQGELAAAAAQALGATGSPAAEPSLLLALQREQADLRVAAANALSRVGSATAVLPLKETAEGSWLDRELHRVAHQAIVEIQSRLQGAAPGQLSLPGVEGGRLSLAPSDAGQLSLALAEPGQLSLAPDPAGQLSPEEPPHRAREEPLARPV